MGFNFADYDEEVKKIEGLGYLQLITPKEHEDPFGLFIPKPETQKSGFVPDTSWELQNQKFNRTKAPKEQVEGYLTRREPDPNNFGKLLTVWINLVVCRRTPMLVFGPDNFGNIKALDYYYNSQGDKTEKGLLCSGDNAYHYGVKYLIYLISNDYNDTLHEYPLQLKTKSAFSGSFGTELKFLYREFNQAFFQAAEEADHYMSGSQLSAKALTCVKFSFKIGIRESEINTGQAGALCCYIAERRSPTNDPNKIGKCETINRKAGSGFNQIKLHYVNWQDLIITKEMPCRKSIIEAHNNYPDWGLPASQASKTDEYPEDNSYTPSNPAINRQELMDKTWAYIQELGWNETQAIDFLWNNFQRKNRRQLTDTQLQELALLLEKQAIAIFADEPKPSSQSLISTKPPLLDRKKLMSQSLSLVKELDWSLNSAIAFLQKTYKKDNRDQLTDSELFDLVAKLQKMVLNQ